VNQWNENKRGRQPGLDADVVENTPTTTRGNGGKPSSTQHRYDMKMAGKGGENLG